MVASNALLGNVNGPNFVKNQAFFAYDFTNLTGANLSNISNGNAGLNDLTNNNIDAVIVGTPRLIQRVYNQQTVNTIEDLTTQAISTGINGNGIFNRQGFIWHAVVYLGDGNPAATVSLFGGIIPTNIGFNVFLNSTGTLAVAYGNSTGVTIWTSALPATISLVDGINGLVYFQVWFDFVANAVTMFLNGESILCAQTSGNMSTINPLVAWTNTSNMYVGSLNNNGTASSNAVANSFLFCAVTPQFLTFQQNIQMYQYVYDRYFKWQSEIHVTTEASANTLRSTLITSIFNGAGLPTISPTVVTGVTGNAHICALANITNKSSTDSLSFATLDVDGFTWTSVGFLMHTSAASNGNLIINCQGHISDTPAAHESFMSQALALGFDVLFVAPAISSNNNTETNPTVTLQSSGGHNQILTGGLDRVGYNPLALFFFDKVSAVNHLDASYTEIYFCGISGGGWSTILMAAMDTRITRAVSDRGYMPRTFKFNEAVTDYEQNGALFTSVKSGPRQYDNATAVSYLDMCLMATTGGRKFHGYTNRFDDCCFNGITFWYWRKTIRDQAATWGGDFWHEVNMVEADGHHMYQASDIAYILAQFS